MRVALIPVEIPESCSLAEAIHWVEWRIYPLGDTFLELQEQMLSIGIPIDPEDQVKRRRALEDARNDLVAHFRMGQITARGFCLHRDGEEEQWEKLNIFGEPQPNTEIPKDAWAFDRVDWHKGMLSAWDASYCEIVVPTKSLFQYFPEPAATETTVERRGEIFVWNGELPNLRKGAGGRPPKFDWDRIRTEIILMVNEDPDGLPEKQADLERRLFEWWAREHPEDEAPSVASLRRVISPIYTAWRQRKAARKT